MAEKDKVVETIDVRGICASIQAMAMPNFENLRQILEKFGYTLVKK